MTTRSIALFSIIVGVSVFALKLAAWWLTGSVALYSDALESLVNVATAIATLFAVWYAARPADSRHPYGHHKAEYLSAVAEGVLIVVAALAIFRAAVPAFSDPREIGSLWQGVVVSLGATAINAAWAAVLVREGRRRHSLAMVADGRHLWTDVLSSLGVAAGLVLASLTGQPWLDPALACLVALVILVAGWRLINESLGGLMDESVQPRVLARIRELISAHGDGAIEAHDLRTRRAGRALFIEFHLVVDGALSVLRAHEICDRIEGALKTDFDGAVITIHVEPEHKRKHQGVVVLA